MNNLLQQPVIPDGTERTIDGKSCVFYEGYWIRRYELPKHVHESYAEKKTLIKMLTKRVFRNTETGMNTPGNKLDIARHNYEINNTPEQKRIHAGMLAGALLNRAADILTHVVELQKDGVCITSENELIRQCGQNLMEALELGKNVKHYSGAEGIDELWGEPFKAFSYPIEEFYKSRYQKVGLSMAMIDNVAASMCLVATEYTRLNGLHTLIKEYANTAKSVTETAKSDPMFLSLWPQFVSNGERILNPKPYIGKHKNRSLSKALSIIKSGKNLIQHISSARVPMPKSFEEYKTRCETHIQKQKKKICCH